MLSYSTHWIYSTVNLRERESETGIARWLSGLQDLLAQYNVELKGKATLWKIAALENIVLQDPV